MTHGASQLAVLVPVKAFHQAKLRLSAALDDADREALARAMATAVVKAAAPLPVSVVCDDDSVASWAEGEGAEVLWTPGRGLDGAVTEGVDVLGARRVERVIVAHADLPHARELASVGDFDGITLVPDRRDDGTNVLAVPARSGFRFAYGAGSFIRHHAEAARLDLAVRVVREERLAWDVDHPDDLSVPDWAVP